MAEDRNEGDANDNLRDGGDTLGCGPIYPQFNMGPYEEVLVFNSAVKI